jgi:hypothetical protein
MSKFVHDAAQKDTTKFSFVLNANGMIDFSSDSFRPLKLNQGPEKVANLRRCLKEHFISELQPGMLLRKEHKEHCPGVLLNGVHNRPNSKEWVRLRDALESIVN